MPRIATVLAFFPFFPQKNHAKTRVSQMESSSSKTTRVENNKSLHSEWSHKNIYKPKWFKMLQQSPPTNSTIISHSYIIL